MALLGHVLAAPLKALGLVSTPDKTPVAQALPVPQRADAAAQLSAADDELRRRRGGAADLVTGAGGAGLPLSGGKLTLGS
ncbi:hypothetical protein [Sphingomonas sp. BK235]|uniref:hypothetical protein n=1 Tax=Sphingomonas sp. BK235 TaxID=2512131 RepID=UPI00104925C7|nr:hypothetical protein [Sphingomonas sp. BK235]TCP35905.1 hypothetical protein EV292_102495 [Sphingomonas sp. BK235]